MKRKLSISLVLVLLLSLAALPALANTPTDASGEWLYLPTSLAPDKIAGGNGFFDLEETGVWTGTFEGTSFDYGKVVFFNSGAMNFIGTVEFDGQVNGENGSLVMKVNGRKASPTANWEGSWVIISGEGGLSDLRGQGRWWGPGFDPDNPDEYGVIEYSGKVH